MITENRKEKILDYIFKISILGKGVDGILETIGGFLLLFINTNALNSFITRITQHELVEDPNDLIANWLIQTAASLPINIKIFGAIYLLSHGIIKIVIVASLLKNKLWAYPTAIIFFITFVAYQLYRLSYSYSTWLLLLTIFDVFIILLTWHEYHQVKNRLNKNSV